MANTVKTTQVKASSDITITYESAKSNGWDRVVKKDSTLLICMDTFVPVKFVNGIPTRGTTTLKPSQKVKVFIAKPISLPNHNNTTYHFNVVQTPSGDEVWANQCIFTQEWIDVVVWKKIPA
jgi:hypothetical protein